MTSAMMHNLEMDSAHACAATYTAPVSSGYELLQLNCKLLLQVLDC